MNFENTLDGTRHKSVHTTHVRVDRTVYRRVGKRLWQDFDKIFAMPHWPPWFMGLDVLVMVKAGM